jgi:hypothetical protein
MQFTSNLFEGDWRHEGSLPDCVQGPASLQGHGCRHWGPHTDVAHPVVYEQGYAQEAAWKLLSRRVTSVTALSGPSR